MASLDMVNFDREFFFVPKILMHIARTEKRTLRGGLKGANRFFLRPPLQINSCTFGSIIEAKNSTVEKHTPRHVQPANRSYNESSTMYLL